MDIKNIGFLGTNLLTNNESHMKENMGNNALPRATTMFRNQSMDPSIKQNKISSPQNTFAESELDRSVLSHMDSNEVWIDRIHELNKNTGGIVAHMQQTLDQQSLREKNNQESVNKYRQMHLDEAAHRDSEREASENIRNFHFQELEARDTMIDQLQDQLDTANKEIQNLKLLHRDEEVDLSIKRVKLEESEILLSTLTSQVAQLERERVNLKLKQQDIDGYITKLEAERECYDLNRKKMHETIMNLKGNIRVFVRLKPYETTSSGEEREELQVIYSTSPITAPDELIIEDLNGKKNFQGKSVMSTHRFKFDAVFPEETTQQSLFNQVSELIQSSCDGYNVCIFVYGQTGSGKTHTMFGDYENLLENTDQWGIIPRSIGHVFNYAKGVEKLGLKYSFYCEFIEIYNEQVIDLLSLLKDHPMFAKNISLQDSVSIASNINNDNNQQNSQVPLHSTPIRGTALKPGPTDFQMSLSKQQFLKYQIKDPGEAPLLIKHVHKNRHTSSTHSNAVSSRSHVVFRIHQHCYNAKTNETTTSILNLVDLAGSERLAQSQSHMISQDRLKETQNINTSLSALAAVMQALAQREKHIPYRNSKLTHLLQNSLGGNSKTLMLVTIAQEHKSFQESICSLKFGSIVNQVELGQAKRVQCVTNSPTSLTTNLPSTLKKKPSRLSFLPAK